MKTDCEKAQGYATAVGNPCKKVLREREKAKSAQLTLHGHCSASLWRRKAVLQVVESAAAGRVVTVGGGSNWYLAAATAAVRNCVLPQLPRVSEEERDDSDPRRKDSCCVAKGQVSLVVPPRRRALIRRAISTRVTRHLPSGSLSQLSDARCSSSE